MQQSNHFEHTNIRYIHHQIISANANRYIVQPLRYYNLFQSLSIKINLFENHKSSFCGAILIRKGCRRTTGVSFGVATLGVSVFGIGVLGVAAET